MHILKLQLLTRDPAGLCNFYTNTLGLRPIAQNTLKAGATQLEFKQGEDERYHFAFNIPENQFNEAVAWLKARVSLIRDSGGAETFSFRDWNAHAVYFYDAAGNILELIARHDLPNASDQPFSGDCFLSVSEIGLALDDVPTTADLMHEKLGLPYYRGKSSGDEFQAMGDEHGLFILVKRDRAWFPETGIKAGLYPTTIVIEGENELTIPPYQICTD